MHLIISKRLYGGFLYKTLTAREVGFERQRKAEIQYKALFDNKQSSCCQCCDQLVVMNVMNPGAFRGLIFTTTTLASMLLLWDPEVSGENAGDEGGTGRKNPTCIKATVVSQLL